MTKDEIYTAAITNQSPELMRPYEQTLYFRLRCILLTLKAGEIAQAHATAEKLEAFRAFDSDKVDYDNGINAMHRTQELYKRTEIAASNYRRNKTIENADKLVEVITN